MDYIDYLKEKYNSDFKSAYKEYHFSKDIYRTYSINNKFVSDENSGSFLQKDINNYIEKIVSEKELVKFNNLTKDELMNYAKKNFSLSEKINMSRSQYISLIAGARNVHLESAVQEIKDWNNLEKLIIEEKNNCLNTQNNEYQSKLDNFCQKFGFTSVFLNKIQSNNSNIDKLDKQFSQLASIMNIQNHQVGLGKLSLHIDTEEANHAGSYSSNQKILFLNNRLSKDALAHEWFHAIDNLIAEHNNNEKIFITDDETSQFFKLVQDSKKQEQQTILEINKSLIENTKVNLDLSIERELKVRASTNSNLLKEIIHKEYTCIVNKEESNTSKLKEKIKELCPETFAFPAFIATELNILKNFVDKKQYDTSFFYNYSKEIQNHFNDLMDDDYSNKPVEMIARMFESYTDGKVSKLGEENIISEKNNNWVPTKEENSNLEKNWKPVVEFIKKNLNEIAPPNIQIPEVSNLLKKISNFENKKIVETKELVSLNKSKIK